MTRLILVALSVAATANAANRQEQLYLGIGASYTFHDRAPGLHVDASLRHGFGDSVFRPELGGFAQFRWQGVPRAAVGVVGSIGGHDIADSGYRPYWTVDAEVGLSVSREGAAGYGAAAFAKSVDLQNWSPPDCTAGCAGFGFDFLSIRGRAWTRLVPGADDRFVPGLDLGVQGVFLPRSYLLGALSSADAP